MPRIYHTNLNRIQIHEIRFFRFNLPTLMISTQLFFTQLKFRALMQQEILVSVFLVFPSYAQEDDDNNNNSIDYTRHAATCQTSARRGLPITSIKNCRRAD